MKCSSARRDRESRASEREAIAKLATIPKVCARENQCSPNQVPIHTRPRLSHAGRKG